MKHKMSRFSIVIFMISCMFLTLLPTSVWATEEPEIPADAIYISDAEDFIEFANNCRAEAKQFSPLPDEKGDEEFNKLRKMFYTFEVYNPETKKTEYKDFSKLIDTDIKINEKANAIINECENIRHDVRKKMFDLCKADKRYLSVIPLAHHLLKEKIKNIGKNDDVCLIIPQKQKGTKGKNISAVLAKQKEKSK